MGTPSNILYSLVTSSRQTHGKSPRNRTRATWKDFLQIQNQNRCFISGFVVGVLSCLIAKLWTSNITNYENVNSFPQYFFFFAIVCWYKKCIGYQENVKLDFALFIKHWNLQYLRSCSCMTRIQVCVYTHT